MASPISIEEITAPARATAAVLPGRSGARFAIRVNRALANALALRHRVSHSLEIRAKLPPLAAKPPASREEELLRAIFGEAPPDPPPEGMVAASGARVPQYERIIWHREGDVRFADAKAGDVESVERVKHGLRTGIGEKITVVVGWPGPLQIGDVLYAGDTAIGVVEAIEEDGSPEPRVFVGAPDPAFGGTVPIGGEPGGRLELTRRTPTAEQQVEARAIGPYSLVSQMPVSGQRIRPGQITWLAEHGCRAVAGEFATFKSSDVLSRILTFENLVKREPIRDPWSHLRPPAPPPGPAPAPAAASGGSPPMKEIFNFFEKPKREAFTNDALKALDCELRVLGISLTLDEHDLRVSLAPPRDLEWSHGAIKKPETLDSRTLAPVAGGLFCPKIFGPVKDYECACGKYRRMKHRGTVCETCGVEVIQSKVRRERLAHLVLPVPIVPRHFRRLVSALIGENAKSWAAQIDQDGGERLRGQLGSANVAARASALPRDHRDRALLDAFATSGVAPVDLMWNVMPVLPPDLRPLVPIAGGRFATSDLNDLYRRLVNRAKRLERLLELDAPPAILVDERKMVRLAADQLLFNGAKGMPKLKYQGRPLVSLFSIVKRKLRPEPAGIRSDYSAAATALVERRERVAVPFDALFELSRPILYGLAEERGHAETIKGAKRLLEEDAPLRRELLEHVYRERPVLLANALLGDALTAALVEIGEDPVIRVPEDVARRIELRTGGRVAIYLPLSEPGIEEARALVRGDLANTPVRRTGWIAELGAVTKGAADRLVELAVARAEDPCETPHAAMLVGGWQLRQ